jgi:pimeloyl-ACP methyl ester carboxylesterase
MTTSPESKQDTHGYVDVNGLKMYYETHGPSSGQPLVLLHGGMSAIGTSFGKLLPGLAQSRRIIALEQQAHGHTADIDRPFSMEQLADDTAAALQQLGVASADIFGYSLGAGIALQVAIRHPELAHKLVLASVTYNSDGFHPGLQDGMANLKPEDFAGTPFYEEYLQIAPHPEDFPRLVGRMKQLDGEVQDWPAEVIKAITSPALLIFGDSDVIRPEHAVEMFRLFGGGVMGDMVGLPHSQLAILPGTTHITVVQRVDLLLAIIPAFLDTPMPESK